MTFKTLETYPLKDRFVVMRGDLNVPLNDEGQITDDSRIEALIPTLKKLIEKGAKVTLLSHLGRPKGQTLPELSLKPIANALSEKLGQEVLFFEKTRPSLQAGQIALRENVRFDAREEKNDPDFAKELSTLGEIFIQDAFATSHRAHASTVGIAEYIPSVAGLLVEKELTNLNNCLLTPKQPVLALVGGAKISTKIELLKNLVKKVDMLVLGGGMANTFLHAKGFDMKDSLCEKEMKDTCLEILVVAKENNCDFILPKDLTVAKEFKAHSPSRNVDISDLEDGDMALDLGEKSIGFIKEKIDNTKTLLWNGPMGAFELAPFDTATTTLAHEVATQTKSNKLLSVAGGGDTVAALNHANVSQNISYISTAGGAFLEWLEGKDLPGISILKSR